jgi:RNA polymerase sigma-70 factor, ECF subfamily
MAIVDQQPKQGPQQDEPASSAVLERYRAYLTVLAHTRVSDRALRDRLDLSGVVQQTLLEAHQKWGEFRCIRPPDGGRHSLTGQPVAGWLRQILAHNLADAMRSAGRAKRGADRVRSLEDDLGHSSLRLGELLVADQPSPSLRLCYEERAVFLADALARLPDAQREVILLHHCHGWPLSRIADHVSRTPPSVAGLLQRGMRALREHLEAPRRKGDV